MRRIRALLVNPPSPERLGSPLLGQQYVAAALVRHGCDVRVLDAAARHATIDAAAIAREVDAFSPDFVGIALFTRWVWHAYELAKTLRGTAPLLVAGGAHATARPFEPLDHGFDAAIAGESEHAIVQLATALAAGESLDSVPGIVYRDARGDVRHGPCATAISDLDTLAEPVLAHELYDPLWYDPSGREVIPGGILTSRGCPAHCTFCANYVTGRKFRHRSAECVVRELNAFHRRCGATFFPCWDDALTADRRRLSALCDTLERDIDFPLSWSAITRASMVSPEMFAAMRRAGLVAVNFGVESGDDDILRAIKKGVNTNQVVRALEWAKDAGLRTACNFMLGFPQETPEALGRTLRFMERIAPLVDTFSTLGVLIPFPATPLYDQYHEAFGFTEWWLRADYSRYTAPPPMEDSERFYRYYIDDATLELDFFRYSPELQAAMREVLRFKAEHNLRGMGVLKDPVFRPAPRELWDDARDASTTSVS